MNLNTLLQTKSSFSNSTGVDGSLIIQLKSSYDGYMKKYSENLAASRNWGKPAWEDAKNDWRKNDYDDFYNKCVAVTGTPCLSDNQTGRKDRYRDRLSKAQGYWIKAQASKKSAEETNVLLQDATAAKEAYDAALATGTALGQSPEQVAIIYQEQLDTIQAEQDKIKADTVAAEALASANPNIKYFIIGGAILGGLALLAIIKRK